VAAKENKKIFIAPDEGANLPVLDIAHKVPSGASAVRLRSWSGAFLPA